MIETVVELKEEGAVFRVHAHAQFVMEVRELKPRFDDSRQLRIADMPARDDPHRDDRIAFTAIERFERLMQPRIKLNFRPSIPLQILVPETPPRRAEARIAEFSEGLRRRVAGA